MPRPIGWRAWYTGDRVYDSQFDDWIALPKTGVLVLVVFFDDCTKEVISGVRRYFRAHGSSIEFFKGTLWTEKKILKTYKTAPDEIKEGVWDDDYSMQRARTEAQYAEIDDGH